MLKTILTINIVIFASFFLIASPTLAIDPLVPCGREGTPPCTTCDILVLGNNVANFILFYLVPAIAALFFIYAGFQILLGGGIPSKVQAGQNLFKTTAYGLMIIFLAWLIVNTVLRTVAGDSNIAEEWWKLECTEVIPTTTTTTIATTTTSGGATTTLPGGTTVTTTLPVTTTIVVAGGSTTTLAGSTTTTARSTTTTLAPTTTLAGSTTTTIRSTTTTKPPAGTTTTTIVTTTTRLPTTTTQRATTTTQRSTTTTTASALACMFQGVNYSTFNLCSGQRRPGGCGNSTCAQYLPSINRYAGGAVSVTVLKTFLVIESDCNIRAATASSYGLMQLRPETANMFKSACGVTENITSSWLTNLANADKSICIGAAFIRSLASGTCGSEPRNIYAGYNAGPGNCAPSRDCGNEQSCRGGTKKKWECPYDNPEHTICNVGLPSGTEGLWQTKQGATYVNYCLNNLGF